MTGRDNAPCVPLSAICALNEEFQEQIEDALRVPRATAQARFAEEMGVDFAACKTVKKYVRIRTRLNVWQDDNLGSPPEEWAPDEVNRVFYWSDKDNLEAHPVWLTTLLSTMVMMNNNFFRCTQSTNWGTAIGVSGGTWSTI